MLYFTRHAAEEAHRAGGFVDRKFLVSAAPGSRFLGSLVWLLILDRFVLMKVASLDPVVGTWTNLDSLSRFFNPFYYDAASFKTSFTPNSSSFASLAFANLLFSVPRTSRLWHLHNPGISAARVSGAFRYSTAANEFH